MKKLLKKALVLILISLTILELPEAHRLWLRHKIESQTVRITNKEQNSGGTGVHIKLSSGHVGILTNAHVCKIKDDKGIVWVGEDDKQPIPRKVIQESDVSDLCLIEPLNHHSGLSLANGAYKGQMIYAIGHPKLMPITMTNGELIGLQYVDILDHFGTDNCELPKNRKMNIDSLFGKFSVCMIHVPAYMTTALILPGSSGSPMVNRLGNVVGLMFAADMSNWGLAVTLDQIQNFIKNY